MVGLYRHRNPSRPSAKYDVNNLGLSSIPLNPFRAPSGGGNLNKHRATCCLVTFQDDLIYPSNAEATFVRTTRNQRFLKNIHTLSCWYSWKALAECPQMSTHMPGFQAFFRFLHIVVLVKLATCSIRFNQQPEW